MKILIALVSLLVLLIPNSFAVNINNIFNTYKNRDVKLCFRQISINGMTGQTIERQGLMLIKAKKTMEFRYPDETVFINNFQVIDKRDNKTNVYKLQGFNRALFYMFLGKEDLHDLFAIRQLDNSTYQMSPRYQSNIASIFVYFEGNRVKEIKVVDIYANKTEYFFYDPPCKRTQKGD